MALKNITVNFGWVFWLLFIYFIWGDDITSFLKGGHETLKETTGIEFSINVNESNSKKAITKTGGNEKLSTDNKPVPSQSLKIVSDKASAKVKVGCKNGKTTIEMGGQTFYLAQPHKTWEEDLVAVKCEQ